MHTFRYDDALIGLRKLTKTFEKHDLLDVDATKNHLVVVDGYRSSRHESLLVEFTEWRKSGGNQKRRLVFLCSMSSRGSQGVEEDRILRVEEFRVFSWTLDEYRVDVQDATFFDNVKPNLDATS